MLFDETSKYGREPGGPRCLSCKRPIEPDQRSTRVHFNSDPKGIEGLTGEYHMACSKPFASLAHVANFNPWSRW